MKVHILRGEALNPLEESHQQVVCIIQGGLLVIKGREAHALEMPPVTLLTAHHDPHGSPLCHVHRLDDPRDLVHKADGTGDVVEHLCAKVGLSVLF